MVGQGKVDEKSTGLLEVKHFARRVARISGSSRAGKMSWGKGPGQVRDRLMGREARPLLGRGEDSSTASMSFCPIG